MSDFARTTAIDKILALKNRIKVVQGGTWAGKTYAIIPILIEKATTEKRKLITVVAETIPALKDGAIRIFKEIMQDTNRWNDERWNAVDNAYTFWNKSVIQFKSFDSLGKAKASGKRDILFVNEANHNPFAIIDALMMRTEGEIYLDYNPDDEFWAHSELLTRKDVDFLILTYHDNEKVPQSIIDELMVKASKAFYNVDGDWNDPQNIKSAYWANWCRVYIKGEIGSLEGVIFNNWGQIDNIPNDARLLGYGLDWGFSVDPTAIIAVYKYNDVRILDEVLYRNGMINSEIAKFIPDGVNVYADSAESKSIEEIRILGKKIFATKKGPDSINYGLQLMQGQRYLVTRRSVNLIKELRGYCWDKDKSGASLNKPIGVLNHAIDAVRYHEMMTLVSKPTWDKIWV